MLGTDYFYNGNVKKIIAVFGSLFNDMSIAKVVAGKSEGITRVPLAYGPRQRFLERLPTSDVNSITHVALRMPRMSFEITSITFDSSTKLNRLNSTTIPIGSDASLDYTRVYQAAPYKIGIQLSILSHHQDDALQIFEQILPYFNPEYTVTVKDMEYVGSKTDLPIVLTNTSFTDDYTGSIEGSQRVIIYTLDFDIRVKFTAPAPPVGVIKYVDVELYDSEKTAGITPVANVITHLGDMINDTPSDYTVAYETFGFLE